MRGFKGCSVKDCNEPLIFTSEKESGKCIWHQNDSERRS